MPHVLVRDIETVPDLVGFAAANGHEGKTEDEIRAELGDKFSKHIYHSIICIGALIAPVPPVPLLDGFRDAFLASALEVLFFEASRFAIVPPGRGYGESRSFECNIAYRPGRCFTRF